jgi:hypothetical protein
MVATTFAADTPLVVTGVVARRQSRELDLVELPDERDVTVFFYARCGAARRDDRHRIRGDPLLRQAAAFLRGFRSVYLASSSTASSSAGSTLAMVTILGLIFGITKGEAHPRRARLDRAHLVHLHAVGLWGVLVTDMCQFVIKMSMVIVLARLRGKRGRRHRSDEEKLMLDAAAAKR